MKTHLVVGNQDLTKYIIDGSYNVYAKDVTLSWENGNAVTTTIIPRTRVEGKFKIECAPGKLALGDFLTLWNNAVTLGAVTIGLYVINTDSFEALECNYEIKSAEHIKSTGDVFYDVLEISSTER